MSVKVKICGLTNKDDAIWAVNFGADYLGFIFYKESSRHVSQKTDLEWIAGLPPFVPKIAVFVNETAATIAAVVEKGRFYGVQLHGDETPDFISELRTIFEAAGKKVFIVKSFRVKDEADIKLIEAFIPIVDGVLLDTFVEGELGGTGQVFNWELAIQTKNFGKPVFLAGGLTPENVKEAIKTVQPFSVDVSSGVEKSVRKKDHAKMDGFIKNAKA